MPTTTIFPIWHNGESHVIEANDNATPRDAIFSEGESHEKLKGWTHKICGIIPAKVAGQERISISKIGGQY